ncbi:rCG41896 [Rattus norvegicus]|uniref:RCG41896 n=1 Tax=Rattus norvegicus TaxID=10116 RepID=A6KKM5_RAT|nr:rCG41896 [Rattus norvegicus]
MPLTQSCFHPHYHILSGFSQQKHLLGTDTTYSDRKQGLTEDMNIWE